MSGDHGNGNPLFRGWIGHPVWACGARDWMRTAISTVGDFDVEEYGGRDWGGIDRARMDRNGFPLQIGFLLYRYVLVR